MASEIIMPRLTHDMQAGTLIKWLKKEGDLIEPGMPLFEVETDKAISEVAAQEAGKLAGIQFEAGRDVAIGSVLGYILMEGENLPADRVGVKVNPRVEIQDDKSLDRPIAESPPKPSKIIATPIARRVAYEKNVDLRLVNGSGPRGRIIESDVQHFLLQRTEVVQDVGAGSQPGFDRLPLTPVQQATARRMSQSNRDIPQFVLEEDVNMAYAKIWRDQFQNVHQIKPSYTSLLIRVVSSVLERYPMLNASFDDGWVRQYKEINIGVATSTNDGLHVPVIRMANKLNVKEIQSCLDQIRKQAEQGKFEAKFIGWSTFTITNLGMYGITRFKALINPPEAAILAVGAIRNTPWCLPAGELGVAPVMTLRLSLDHRVVDGATAAPFLVEIKSCLENLALII